MEIEYTTTRTINMTNTDLDTCMKSAMEFFKKNEDLDVQDFYINKSWQGKGYDMQVTVGTPKVFNEIDTNITF